MQQLQIQKTFAQLLKESEDDYQKEEREVE
jgi:hypothetical protein